jgi:muconolactone D-isomerase
MLFHLHMIVRIPPDADPALIQRLRAEEKARALELQRKGTWLHLWRVVGRNENYSVIDVSSHDELHEILTSLPLFPYLDITVTPIATHPSALPANEG